MTPNGYQNSKNKSVFRQGSSQEGHIVDTGYTTSGGLGVVSILLKLLVAS